MENSVICGFKFVLLKNFQFWMHVLVQFVCIQFLWPGVSFSRKMAYYKNTRTAVLFDTL